MVMSITALVMVLAQRGCGTIESIAAHACRHRKHHTRNLEPPNACAQLSVITFVSIIALVTAAARAVAVGL